VYSTKRISSFIGELAVQAERKVRPSTHDLIWIMPT